MERITSCLKNKLIKETLWSFLSKGSAFFLFLAVNIYLARALGVELFGRWSVLYSFLTVYIVASYLGINASAGVFVAKYKNEKQIRHVLKSSLAQRVSVSLLFSLGFLVFRDDLFNLLGKSDVENILLSATPLIFMLGLLEYFKRVFVGLHRLKFLFIVTFLEYGLKLVFVVLFLKFSLSLVNIINAYSLAVFAAMTGGFVIFYKFYLSSPKNIPDKGFGLKILKYSLPLYFTNLGNLFFTDINTLLLGYLAGDKEVGIYSVSNQLINKLPQLSLAISLGTMPLFAEINRKNIKERQRKFLRLMKINFKIYLPLTVTLIFFSPYFIPILFGASYREAVIPLQILSFWVFMHSFNLYNVALLNYQGRAAQKAVHFLVTIIFNIFLNILLIPRYGAVGAAIATTVSYLPYAFLNWHEVTKILKEYSS